MHDKYVPCARTRLRTESWASNGDCKRRASRIHKHYGLFKCSFFSKSMKKIKKKSSIFSLSPFRIIMLFVGLFTVLFFIKTPQNLNLKKKAAASVVPSNISIVNITDRS